MKTEMKINLDLTTMDVSRDFILKGTYLILSGDSKKTNTLQLAHEIEDYWGHETGLTILAYCSGKYNGESEASLLIAYNPFNFAQHAIVLSLAQKYHQDCIAYAHKGILYWIDTVTGRQERIGEITLINNLTEVDNGTMLYAKEIGFATR